MSASLLGCRLHRSGRPLFPLSGSGSIRDNNPFDRSYDNWDLLLRFVLLVIDKFDIGPNALQVEVVKFSNDSQLVIRLDHYRSKEQLNKKMGQSPQKTFNRPRKKWAITYFP